MFNDNLITGIIAAFIASFGTWFFVKILRVFIIPGYQHLVYQGHLISGDWEGFYPEFVGKTSKRPSRPNFFAHLDQLGHNISGEMFLVRQPNGEKCEKHFSLSGNFKDDDLVLNFKVEDQTQFGFGTFLLQLKHDGELLDGVYTHFEAMHDTVGTDIVAWERVIK